MIHLLNKKLELYLQFFCIFLFVYICICVFLYLNWPSPPCLAKTPALPLISRETNVTDWHKAPSVCVPGTASVTAH